MRMTTITVLTWNIHKGFASSRRQLSLSGIRTILHEVAADLVLLQEVVGRNDRHAARYRLWPSLPQAEYLAEGRWEQLAYAPNAHSPHGHHGNALLSKLPITAWENIDLSNHSWERRGVLHAQVRCAGIDPHIHVMCTHLDLLHRGRIRQVERIAERIRSLVPPEAPLLLAGDFNDWGQRLSRVLEHDLGLVEAHRVIHGGLGRSFPARLPILMLDRLYVRGLEVRSARMLGGRRWHQYSDHVPLLVELGASS
jgi:endonuclease/exonuclease/phosphatase family metal-dependent hydrolase